MKKEDFASPEQYSELMSIPLSTVYYLCKTKQLPGARKYGKHWRIHLPTATGVKGAA